MNEEEIVEAILGKIFWSTLSWKRPTLVDGECPHSNDLFDKFESQREEALDIARIKLTKTVDLDPSAILKKLKNRTLSIGTLEQRLLDNSATLQIAWKRLIGMQVASKLRNVGLTLNTRSD